MPSRISSRNLGHPAKAMTGQPLKQSGQSLKRKATINDHATQHESMTADGPSRSTKKAKTSHTTGQSTRLAQRTPALSKTPDQALNIIVFGSGECGELGLGPSVTEASRAMVNSYFDEGKAGKFEVVQLCVGGMHVVALTSDNRIVTWGVNDKGALGRNTKWEGRLRDMDADDSSEDEIGDVNPLESTPTAVSSTAVPNDTTFVQVAAGDSCSFALTNTGSVYGWGTFLNSEGKERFCFDRAGNFIKRLERPSLLHGLQNITQIACGANHALALDSSGNIWAWGVNEQGQLGRRQMARKAVGRLGPLDSFFPHRIEICRNNAKYIASGQFHSFAVDHKDNVWGWGLNSFGEAGYARGAGTDSVTTPCPMKIPDLCGKGVSVLDGGAHHSGAVTADGQCFVWGRIDGGQLGVEFSAAQLADESLILRDGRGRPRICTRPVSVSEIGKISYVSCGTDHTIFVGCNGNIFSSGFGPMGQLGHGDDVDEVLVARQVKGRALKDRFITWTGAGGQFSVVAERRNRESRSS